MGAASESTSGLFSTDRLGLRLLQLGAILGLLFVVLSLPIMLQGQSLVDFYGTLFRATFGTPDGLTQTVIKTSPVFLAAIGVLIAFRAGVWNIGSEGQIAIGAVVGSAVVYGDFGLGGGATIVVTLLAAFLAGGLFANVAGVLKVKMGINEILTTLMLNFIAIQLVAWGAQSVWQSSGGFPFSRPVPPEFRLPELVPGVHIGILVAVGVFGLMVVLLLKTTWGYEFRAIGEDKEAARQSGIRVDRKILVAFFISGGLAGLAGAIELLGVFGRLETGITGPDFGYLAIIATLLANERLRYLPIAALVIGALLAAQIALSSAVSDGVELFVMGAILLTVLAFNRAQG
jgi:simple sugar transport system permease protein